MGQPTSEEIRTVISMCREHHKRLRDLEEYLHFPPDYGPADHVSEHVSSKLNAKRRADNQSQIIRFIAGAAILFLFGLLAMGAKQWILQ